MEQLPRGPGRGDANPFFEQGGCIAYAGLIRNIMYN
jgi:hypothetical protein